MQVSRDPGTLQGPHRDPFQLEQYKKVKLKKNVTSCDKTLNMPYYYRRMCPICGKQGLLKLSNHLAQVHRLFGAERTSWLNSALFTPSAPYMTSYPMTLPTRENKCPLETSQNKCLLKTVNCLETQAYPEFKFQHMFSMMVVGPSQSGKTYFVQQLLTKNCINYPEKKPIRVYWFYNQ